MGSSAGLAKSVVLASSSTSCVLLLRRQPRCRKYVPDGDEHGRNYRPDDKTVETKNRYTAQRGDQHDVIRHLGVLADEIRTEEVVHQANYECAVRNQNEALPHGTRRQKIDGNR